MALNKETLASLITTKIDNETPGSFTNRQKIEIDRFSKALAAAIIDHIKDNAEVAVTTNVGGTNYDGSGTIT